MLKNTKKSEKLKEFMKKFGVYICGGMLTLIIAVTVIVTQTPNKGGTVMNIGEKPIEVQAPVQVAGLPLSGAVVIKDYSDSALQYNATLKHWEAHKAVDLTSETSNEVLAVLDGKILSITQSYEEGTKLIIEHNAELKTIYSSIINSENLKPGDSIKKGDKIGETSKTANNENYENAHVHFEVLKNGAKVDPNNYINFGEK